MTNLDCISILTPYAILCRHLVVMAKSLFFYKRNQLIGVTNLEIFQFQRRTKFSSNSAVKGGTYFKRKLIQRNAKKSMLVRVNAAPRALDFTAALPFPSVFTFTLLQRNIIWVPAIYEEYPLP